MPTAPRYNRSPILSFYELSDAQKAKVFDPADDDRDEDGETLAERGNYVLFGEGDDDDEKEPLPLGMFMRIENSKIWDGVYGTSYFSAYFLKFHRSGDQVLIAERVS